MHKTGKRLYYILDTMQISLCTWNIHLGKQLTTIVNNVKNNPLLQSLDIYLLQESSEHNGVPDSSQIAKALGNTYDTFQYATSVLQGSIQANAIVWNTKTITKKRIFTLLLPTIEHSSATVLEKRIISLLPKRQRNCIVFEGAIGKYTIRIYVTHFDVIGFTGLHNAQLQYILDDNLNRKKTDVTIVGGDFNTFAFAGKPRWNQMKKMIDAYGFTDATAKTPATFISIPGQKLDKLLYTGSISFKTQVAKIHGSDHYPVLGTILHID